MRFVSGCAGRSFDAGAGEKQDFEQEDKKCRFLVKICEFITSEYKKLIGKLDKK